MLVLPLIALLALPAASATTAAPEREVRVLTPVELSHRGHDEERLPALAELSRAPARFSALPRFGARD